jgi:prevent-host-death family protein
MESIGSFEAKTHLASLLVRVSRGETIVITKHGRPIARLVPPETELPTFTAEEAIRGLREFRQGRRLKGGEVRDLIREGRKY